MIKIGKKEFNEYLKKINRKEEENNNRIIDLINIKYFKYIEI